MAVGYVASATSGSQVSVGSFDISASLGAGARAGLVFVVTYANSGAAIESGVTWNGAAMSLLYSGADTNTEPGIVRAYFLDNIGTGAVTVTRTNNTVVCVGYAISISAAQKTEVAQTKTVGGDGTVNTNANTSTAGTATSGLYALDDGSPGTSSMRFAAAFTGNATPLAAGTGSTQIQTNDQTAFGSSLVYETSAGQGSRNVGFEAISDDLAVVAVAVREAIRTGTGALTLRPLTVAGSGTHYRSTSVAEVSLASASAPSVDTGHNIKVRARVTSGAGTAVLKAALYEGASNRSGDLSTSALTTSLANYTLAISEANAANITSYADLSIRFWGYDSGGAALTFEVDSIHLETPEGPKALFPFHRLFHLIRR